MTETTDLYSGIFRALLTEEALDRAGRKSRSDFDSNSVEIEELVGISVLDEELVARARTMSIVYAAIAAFENTVREFITKVMLENVGANWWEANVSEKIRKAAEQRREEESKIKWHTQRGDDPINYTMLPNLVNILRQNQEIFAAFLPDIDWAASIFDTIERSRNVIMHSGTLTKRDIARLGSLLRDWSAQVGT